MKNQLLFNMQKNKTNYYPKKENRTITNQPYSMRNGNYDARESPFDRNENGFYLNFFIMYFKVGIILEKSQFLL
jgi:hypothetical protein